MIKPNIYFQIQKNSELYYLLDNAQKKFAKAHSDQLVFCIQSPLGIDTSYSYDGAILLSPKYKITFLGTDQAGFDDYVDDVMDDISSLSKKYNYQTHIGRPREWREKIITKIILNPDDNLDLEDYLYKDENKVDHENVRLVKFLISLFTGSINDLGNDALKEPENLLDDIKKKIILFDADQTRFLFNNYAIKSFISVQGLSGTGKTELLLHKLRDIYSQNESSEGVKIFFTCHNIALAYELKERIPSFFNKMKVSRQIEWNKELWVAHAWGSKRFPNSGLYTYICSFYNIPFQQFGIGVTYEIIFSTVKKELEKIPKKNFTQCFDYILVDENQDFPEVFFEVCKKITRHKVYTAGDVFQNIFYQAQNKPKGVDIALNRCYRTDPRTLMFAHTLGLGLKENKKYNWFEKNEWETFGYSVESNKRNQTITLRRLPITRFDGNEPDESVVVQSGTDINNVCRILNQIKEEYPNIKAGDVSIIMIDDDKDIYQYMDKLSFKINELVGWSVLRGHEDKHTDPDKLYLTNTNNVKGLEFPFVVCITSRVNDNPIYRNKLYTMLTRSFLVSYLIVKDDSQIEWLSGIYKEISESRSIKDIHVPSADETEQIKHALISQSEVRLESWEDFMDKIFNDLGVKDNSIKQKLKDSIISLNIERFNADKIKSFIDTALTFM